MFRLHVLEVSSSALNQTENNLLDEGQTSSRSYEFCCYDSTAPFEFLSDFKQRIQRKEKSVSVHL